MQLNNFTSQVGDAYIAVAGIMQPPSTSNGSSRRVALAAPPLHTARKSLPLNSRVHVRSNLETVFGVALQLQEELDIFRTQMRLPLHLRLGVHCGSVVTGIVGVQRQRFCEYRIPPQPSFPIN